MNYTLTIRQQNAVSLGLVGKVDILDLAILSFLNSVPSNSYYEVIMHEGRPYYWISHSKLLAENPFIKMEQNTLYKRMRNLCDVGLIKLHPNAKSLKRSYYAFTQMFHDLMFSESTNADNTGNKSGVERGTTDLNQEHIGFKSGVTTDLNQEDNNTNNNNTEITENTLGETEKSVSTQPEFDLTVETINNRSNKKETPEKKQKKGSNQIEWQTKLEELGADPIYVRDFLLVRKKKNKTFTETSFNFFLREVEEAKRTVPEVVQACAERGWEGFQRHYQIGGTPPKVVSDSDFEKRKQEDLRRLTF